MGVIKPRRGGAPPGFAGRRLVGRAYVVTDARPRPRADRRGPAPLQETPGTQRHAQGAAQAQVLRKALRGPAPRHAAQAERHPQGPRGRAQGLLPVGPGAGFPWAGFVPAVVAPGSTGPSIRERYADDRITWRAPRHRAGGPK